MREQFVIMFNDCAEEILAEGTTIHQANERAAQIKREYMARNCMKEEDGQRLYVRAEALQVHTP